MHANLSASWFAFVSFPAGGRACVCGCWGGGGGGGDLPYSSQLRNHFYRPPILRCVCFLFVCLLFCVVFDFVLGFGFVCFCLFLLLLVVVVVLGGRLGERKKITVH